MPPLSERTHTGKISRHFFGNSCMGFTTKSQTTGATNREVGSHQTPKLCTAQGTINRAQAPPAE